MSKAMFHQPSKLALFLTLLMMAILNIHIHNPVYGAKLTLTVTTNKTVYNVGETVTISGNLTMDGAPVPDGIVAVQVNDPKGNLHVIRALPVGLPTDLKIEVLQVYLSDHVGNPKTSVKRGTLGYITIIWRNNDIVDRQASITLNLYYGNKQPFLAFVPFTGTVRAGKTQNMTVSVPIPSDAPTGTAFVYSAAFSNLPRHGGYAYCPEKSSTFTITSSSTSTTFFEIEPLQQTSGASGTYNTDFLITKRGAVLGNYTIYASSLYGEQQSSASSTFKVILLGDLNRDGVVDMKDATALLRRYGAVPTDPKWNPEYDLNKDNVIDMKDVTTLLRNYGNYGTY